MKNLPLTLPLLLFAMALNAQTPWPAENAEWYMGHACTSMYDFVQYSVDGTEELGGLQATVIQRADSGLIETDGTIELVSAQKTHYVYFDGDTLFHWFQDAYYPLLIFDAQPGDTWYPLPIDGVDGSCNPAPMRVTQTDMVSYNGWEFRQISIEATSTPGGEEPFFHWEGTFDERTFGRDQLFPEYNDCESVVDFYCYDFRCYSDNALDIHEGDMPCNFPLNTLDAESPAPDTNFEIWPNPATNNLNMRLTGHGTLTVYDLGGRALFRGTFRRGVNVLDTSHWPAGLYLLHMATDRGTVTQKFAVN